MAAAIQAVRGMNDLLPEQVHLWQFIEARIRDVLSRYGYNEIRFPIVESTALFKRSIGEVTDIVEKEMYTFLDRNGDSLTLRPEGTAVCVRAGIEHGLFYNQQQRLWYNGPMFRYERPQKGRYRQFFQCGVEAFGIATPDIDAELIALSARLWRKLGLSDKVTLQLNSLGTPASRAAYREVLVDYFVEHRDCLDEDSVRRLETNPLRILDSKNPALKSLIDNAPSLLGSLDEESRSHLDALCAFLDKANIAFELNPRLVRGLDYYTKTVFEWVTTELGAQGTVCAGGRYDGLVEQLGGASTPACGFAIGLERLVLLMESLNPAQDDHADIYMIAVGDEAERSAFSLVEKLRNEYPSLRILFNCGGGSFKSQFKRADKSRARMALIMGADESASGQCTVKWLLEEKPQVTISHSELGGLLDNYFQ